MIILTETVSARKNNGTFGVYNSLKIPLTQAGWPYCALRQRSGCERVPCGGEEGGGDGDGLAMVSVRPAFA